MSYTLLHTNTKPNRYLELNGVDVFLSGVEKPKAKTEVTPEQQKICSDGIDMAIKIGQQGDKACEPDKKNAAKDLSNYFNLGGYTPPRTSENNISMQGIPEAKGTNPNALSQVVLSPQSSSKGSNNGLPSGMTQNGGGPQQLTVGTKTWINGILQP